MIFADLAVKMELIYRPCFILEGHVLLGGFQVFGSLFFNLCAYDLKNLHLQFCYTIVSSYWMRPELDLFETLISMTCSTWNLKQIFWYALCMKPPNVKAMFLEVSRRILKSWRSCYLSLLWNSKIVHRIKPMDPIKKV